MAKHCAVINASLVFPHFMKDHENSVYNKFYIFYDNRSELDG